MRLGALLFLLSILIYPSWAQKSADYPRFASLKRTEVNVRAGPGTRYPILWVFQRQGWPVQLLTRYENWYKIRDVEGEEGWVYIGMVSPRHTALVAPGEPITLYKDAQGTRPLYQLETNVLVSIESCAEFACKVDVRGTAGYLPKSRLLFAQ